MERDIGQYEAMYSADYGFERTMVEYRQRMLAERIGILGPRVVVEVGCGSDLLYKRLLRKSAPVESWVIVEPASSFHAAASGENLPNARVIGGTMEQSGSEVLVALPRAPDLVICSALLHEVADAPSLLRAMKRLMGTTTVLHVNVPNATSLHRRLARSMSLVRDVHEMSERNRRLLQSRVYDSASLDRELQNAGLDVVATGGYLVKPFTHAQMEHMRDLLDPSIMDGLYRLGIEMPEIASEIFAEAVLA